MKFTKYLMLTAAASTFLYSCGGDATSQEATTEEVVVEEADSNFVWKTEQFADLQINRYKINGWDKLSLNQKKLAYYLTQSGIAGRDMIWDQNYRYNLEIRNALENIVSNYGGDKDSEDWGNFMEYTKRVWFSNGIHHHYSMEKFLPKFSKDYLNISQGFLLFLLTLRYIRFGTLMYLLHCLHGCRYLTFVWN